MIDLKGIKNIIFDFGGVIINIDFKLSIDAFKKLGFADVEKKLFDNQFSDLIIKMELGTISNKAFCENIRLISKLNLSDSQIINAWNALLLDIPGSRVNLLKELKKNYNIYLLSNTNNIHYKKYLYEFKHKYGFKDFDDLFNKAWFSFKIHKAKPKTDIFNFVLKDGMLKPNETLFIDDSLVNIEAAKKLEINTFHLKDNNLEDLFKLKE